MLGFSECKNNPKSFQSKAIVLFSGVPPLITMLVAHIKNWQHNSTKTKQSLKYSVNFKKTVSIDLDSVLL